jgi:hypothetical protein
VPPLLRSEYVLLGEALLLEVGGLNIPPRDKVFLACVCGRTEGGVTDDAEEVTETLDTSTAAGLPVTGEGLPGGLYSPTDTTVVDIGGSSLTACTVTAGSLGL